MDDSRKAKHRKQFRGPMRVVGVSPNNKIYEVEDVKTGQRFERSIHNVNAYRAALNDDTNTESHTDDLQDGDMVAAIDETGDTTYWVARVTGLYMDDVKLHYYATRTVNVATAVFKPAYIGSVSGKTILSNKLSKREEASEPWTGTVSRDLIITKVFMNLDKKGNQRLRAASRAKLHDYVHARL